MNTTNIHYNNNVLSIYIIKWDTYEEPKNEYDPDVPLINDKDNDIKEIKWVSPFNYCLSQNYGYRRPLIYVL